MSRTHFENLKVYQLAERLADDVWDIVARWEPFARDTVGGQVVKAADSVGANIAEGAGRGTRADQRHFVRTARGSLYETKHWLRRAFRRHFLTPTQTESLRDTIDNLTRVLNGYIRSLNRRIDQEAQSKTTRKKAQNLKPKT